MNSASNVSVGTAAFNVIIGMLTVFAILILISLIIYAFRLIPRIQDVFSGRKGAAQPEEDEEEFTVSLAVASSANVNEAAASDAADRQGELIAVIAAAISQSTGLSTDSFVVRSIRRI